MRFFYYVDLKKRSYDSLVADSIEEARSKLSANCKLIEDLKFEDRHILWDRSSEDAIEKFIEANWDAPVRAGHSDT